MGDHIVVLAGDGIGPEVCRVALDVLHAVYRTQGDTLRTTECRVGGIGIDVDGTPLTEATLSACRSADAVLLGAVGGPKWDDPTASVRPEQGLLALRKGLGLFANLRPIQAYPALASQSPLKSERLEGVDFVVVRELTGGLYFGERGREGQGETRTAFDTLRYSALEIERIARVGFELARRRRGVLTSVDKANVLDSSRLWRQVVVDLASDYPDVTLEHQLVDSCAMRLVTQPNSFDVLVTGNMFGDILSDEASVLTGSLGLLPSASLGSGGSSNGRRFGLYEPVHGSAPDIAGQGRANPLATVKSVAMMLRHSLGRPDAASAVESAVQSVLDAGQTTPDLGGSLSTEDVGRALLGYLGHECV